MFPNIAKSFSFAFNKLPINHLKKTGNTLNVPVHVILRCDFKNSAFRSFCSNGKPKIISEQQNKFFQTQINTLFNQTTSSRQFILRSHSKRFIFTQKPPAGDKLVLFEARARGGIVLFSLIDIAQVVFLSYWIFTFSSIEYDQKMQDLGWVNTPFMRNAIYFISFGAITVWLAFSSYNRRSTVSRLMLIPGGRDLEIETYGFMGSYKSRIVPIQDLRTGTSNPNYDRFYVVGEGSYLLDLRSGKYYNQKAADSVLNGKIVKYTPEKK